MTDIVERAFRRHYGTVYRYVRKRSRSHEHAEDLTQEVFAAAAAAPRRPTARGARCDPATPQAFS